MLSQSKQTKHSIKLNNQTLQEKMDLIEVADHSERNVTEMRDFLDFFTSSLSSSANFTELKKNKKEVVI